MIDIIGTTAVGMVVFLAAWFLMNNIVDPKLDKRQSVSFLLASIFPMFVGFYYIGKSVADITVKWGWGL